MVRKALEGSGAPAGSVQIAVMGGDFVDLLAWQRASSLVASLHTGLAGMRGPSIASTRDQMIRAAESIPANIAEGHGRGIGGDCARFLTVARASAAELESHLRVAQASERLDWARAQALILQTREVRYLIHRLLISVRLRLTH